MGRGVSGWNCKELEDMLKDAGWTFDHAEGGHRYYVHARRKGIVTIPWHRR
ncbi:MAG: type II toxin-antitoxin system HicA family toxin [Vulcanimicrobiaceae bacterium]